MKNKYFIHQSSYIDDKVEIGENTKIWHFCHILSNTSIGKNCSFGQNCVIGPNVKIGNGVKAQNNNLICEGVEIDDDVFLGPSIGFTNISNPRSFIVRNTKYLKTKLEKGCSIGANATIVCGNNIGKFAFVGAGAVVTKNIPDYALVVGNPAKQVGWMSEYGHRLNFDNQGFASCEETGHRYQLLDNNVKRIS